MSDRPQLTIAILSTTFAVAMLMKTPISIPDAVFQAAEATAQRLGLSRDELYTKAVQAFIATHANPSVTDTLNQVYEQQPSTLERTIAQLQTASLPRGDW